MLKSATLAAVVTLAFAFTAIAPTLDSRGGLTMPEAQAGKLWNKVKKGAKKVGGAVKKTAKKAGSAVKKTAKKAGSVVKKTANPPFSHM
ncbi:MAG TPA: hypothetical protein VMX97_17010 [Hyphomicrobiaceae bacterium]|nr:hypothetical protein [Hyphomicrobiaceae bacterium]